MERRSFIEMFVAGAVGFTSLVKQDNDIGNQINWNRIRKQYPDSRSKVLNLNNGSAGMMSLDVEKQVLKFISEMNRNPPYEQEKYWGKIFELSKINLAEMIDCSAEELALVRNTTEALNFVLTGYNFPEKSNVVCGDHDYSHATDTLKNLSKERNFKLRQVKINLPADEEDIIEAYRKKINAKTEMVLITSMTHREGQMLPVKQISKLAREVGAKVLVDAAHSIGHYEHSVKDWDCDFYCTSLHKWLGGPLGTGVLYVRKNLLREIRGSYNLNESNQDKMQKFEAVGTKSYALYAAILSAIRYHQKIGTKTKHQRLMELTDYWTKAIDQIPNAEAIVPNKYGGIASFYYPGSSTKILGFFESKNIHLKKVRPLIANRTTYRVSPNIYHSFKDMDRFIEAFLEFSKQV